MEEKRDGREKRERIQDFVSKIFKWTKVYTKDVISSSYRAWRSSAKVLSVENLASL